MVLSEPEAEARLAALRREREALDRAIADLTLYLELGRRLTAGVPASETGGRAAGARDPAPFAAAPSSGRAEPTGDPAHAGVVRTMAAPAGAAAHSFGDRAGTATPPAAPAAGSEQSEPASGTPETKSAQNIPEGALARRYGRALIREAVAVLEEAGRPLHAGEILSGLTARGFAVPGQQDPVAALNTRLWKRAGPGGPLRRLGDAVYALAPAGAEEPGRPD